MKTKATEQIYSRYEGISASGKTVWFYAYCEEQAHKRAKQLLGDVEYVLNNLAE